VLAGATWNQAGLIDIDVSKFSAATGIHHLTHSGSGSSVTRVGSNAHHPLMWVVVVDTHN
jgi:hypothetical protein